MQRTITPFRITLILDGDSAVAQLENMERILDDNGEIISARALPAEPLVYPLSETILGEANAASLARVFELEAQVADIPSKDEQIVSLTEQAAALQAQIDELTATPVGIKPIRAWQAKAVLKLAGLLDAAVAVIDALDEPQKTIVRSAWDNNADFARDSQTVLALAAALSLTEEQLDAMFAQAAALTV